MKVVQFPDRGPQPSEAWLTELDEALAGERDGFVADSWRDLRDDVRALAPAMTAQFEDELQRRIVDRDATGRAARRVRRRGKRLRPRGGPALAAASAAATARRRTVLSRAVRSRAVLSRAAVGRRWRGLRLPTGPAAGAIAAACALAVAVAVVAGQSRVAAPRHGASPTSRVATPPVATPPNATARNAPARTRRTAAPRVVDGAAASQGTVLVPNAAAETAEPEHTSASAPEFGEGRRQELSASISLGAAPSGVQETADRVMRVALQEGGFVQSSRVQTEQHGQSEASLMLKLPSAKLGTALALLGRLAPVRAESQSEQDITSSYDAARQRVAELAAERRGLLHALAGATSEGEVDSLRERLAQNHSQLAEAQAAFTSVSHRASTAGVEVAVIGDARAGSEGLTLHRGLHDAGRVLTVAAIVLLVAASALAPIGLLVLALGAAARAWRRHQRERALGAGR